MSKIIPKWAEQDGGTKGRAIRKYKTVSYIRVKEITSFEPIFVSLLILLLASTNQPKYLSQSILQSNLGK